MHHFLFHGKYSVAENPTHTNAQLNIFNSHHSEYFKETVIVLFYIAAVKL